MDTQNKSFFITSNATIISALQLMDAIKRKLLIVLSKDNKYYGLLSIGDIQRGIIKNISLEEPIKTIMREDYIVSTPEDNIKEIKSLMLKIRAEIMPVVDDKRNVIDVYLWEDLFDQEVKQPLFQFNLPVVIMAGGYGTRLKPLTNVLPKPLIPIKDKTFLEEIFDRFNHQGCDNFYISVNYKADLIEYYLRQLHLPYNISFFREEKPMGTAGSLAMLKNKISSTFFVSNCDILIEQDYSEVLRYHRDNMNEITIIAAMKHYPIAYGTIESGHSGKLLKLVEKPDLTFKINSGMYILEPSVLDEIPENKFFHITDLIEIIIHRGGQIGVFPISEKSWKDVGNWDDYLMIINQ